MSKNSRFIQVYVAGWGSLRAETFNNTNGCATSAFGPKAFANCAEQHVGKGKIHCEKRRPPPQTIKCRRFEGLAKIDPNVRKI